MATLPEVLPEVGDSRDSSEAGRDVPPASEDLPLDALDAGGKQGTDLPHVASIRDCNGSLTSEGPAEEPRAVLAPAANSPDALWMETVLALTPDELLSDDADVKSAVRSLVCSHLVKALSSETHRFGQVVRRFHLSWFKRHRTVLGPAAQLASTKQSSGGVGAWLRSRKDAALTPLDLDSAAEVTTDVQQFEDNMLEAMNSYFSGVLDHHPTVAALVVECVEDAIHGPIYRPLFDCIRRAHIEDDLAVFERSRDVSTLNPAHLSIDQRFWLVPDESFAEISANAGQDPAKQAILDKLMEPPYHSAILLLRTLSSCMTPQAKVHCLIEVGRLILKCISDYWERLALLQHPGALKMKAGDLTVGGDDLLPLFTFVSVKAICQSREGGKGEVAAAFGSHAVSEAAYMEGLMHEGMAMQQGGYMVATFQTALLFAQRLTPEELHLSGRQLMDELIQTNSVFQSVQAQSKALREEYEREEEQKLAEGAAESQKEVSTKVYGSIAAVLAQKPRSASASQSDSFLEGVQSSAHGSILDGRGDNYAALTFDKLAAMLDSEDEEVDDASSAPNSNAAIMLELVGVDGEGTPGSDSEAISSHERKKAATVQKRATDIRKAFPELLGNDTVADASLLCIQDYFCSLAGNVGRLYLTTGDLVIVERSRGTLGISAGISLSFCVRKDGKVRDVGAPIKEAIGSLVHREETFNLLCYLWKHQDGKRQGSDSLPMTPGRRTSRLVKPVAEFSVLLKEPSDHLVPASFVCEREYFRCVSRESGAETPGTHSVAADSLVGKLFQADGSAGYASLSSQLPSEQVAWGSKHSAWPYALVDSMVVRARPCHLDINFRSAVAALGDPSAQPKRPPPRFRVCCTFLPSLVNEVLARCDASDPGRVTVAFEQGVEKFLLFRTREAVGADRKREGSSSSPNLLNRTRSANVISNQTQSASQDGQSLEKTQSVVSRAARRVSAIFQPLLEPDESSDDNASKTETKTVDSSNDAFGDPIRPEKPVVVRSNSVYAEIPQFGQKGKGDDAPKVRPKLPAKPPVSSRSRESVYAQLPFPQRTNSSNSSRPVLLKLPPSQEQGGKEKGNDE